MEERGEVESFNDGVEFHDREEEEEDPSNEEEIENIKDTTNKSEEEPKYGCIHYKCRCAYLSPCCGKEYVCRICHNEAEDHEVDRFSVTKIVCLVCRHMQPVAKECEKCGVTFGNYFCQVCRMFDDNEKKQFHCDKCGICRVGGRECFFHCDKCDYCLDNSLKDSHNCVEKVSRGDCSICLEDLHSSRQQLAVFPCGHICHLSCRNGLVKTGNYYCPLCCQSFCDLGALWKEIDNEIANVPMPEEYQNTKIWILCRDCHQVTETAFHVLGLKCTRCGSYNTCREASPNESPSNSTTATSPSTLQAHPTIDSAIISNITPTTTLNSDQAPLPGDLFYDALSAVGSSAANINTSHNVTVLTNADLPIVIRSNLYSTSSIPSDTNTTLSDQYTERVSSNNNNNTETVSNNAELVSNNTELVSNNTESSVDG